MQTLLSIIMFGSLFGVLTLSLNLQYARGGMINFGTVAYFAAGAYVYAIVTQEPPEGLDQYLLGLDAPWWAGFLAAGVASMAFAILTGWPTLRLRGEYLALTTFAFAEMLNSLLINERRIGNGTVGLSNVERPDPAALGLPDSYVYAGAAFLLMIATALAFRRLLASPYGRAIDAIRDDETAAQAIGKDISRLRFQVFVISAIPIGFAGALYAMITTLVSPELFSAEVTFLVWIALVLGGERTLVGAMLGTMALIGLQELIRAIPFESVRAAEIAAAGEDIVTGILFIIILRWQPFEALVRRKHAE
ncbi:branched-chain amino acid ABC transporter permease [Albidovulum sp.]|jgi:branched-chain amino acid transport system permease protein|uniref:branched-chain amino acid ABC transporter permease n=1 Tax=Albidovulum sp. TaxID=1872424 RepID=UPI0039B9A720